MAFRRLALVLLAFTLVAAPPANAEELTLWADVDESFAYALRMEKGAPAYEFPGYLCTVADGELPSPCVAAADPVVWDLPIVLSGPKNLDEARNVTMVAYFASSPCDFAIGLGCGPDTVAQFEVTSALMQDNTTLLDAGPQDVTVLGEPVQATWSIPSNGTRLDPTLGNLSWRLTVQPVAGLSDGVFLGMAEGTWSNLTLPIAPPPAPMQVAAPTSSVAPTVTATVTTTRTTTMTTTHETTVTSVEVLTVDQVQAPSKDSPAAGLAVAAGLLVLAGFARRGLR